MNPYLLTSVLFLVLAGLAALDSALINFQILPWFNGLRWLRVHLITLGALTEALFSVLPVLAAKRSGHNPPNLRWDIWLALTIGLLILMVGIPLINYVLIVTGGTLIFTATLLLMGTVRGRAPASVSTARPTGQGKLFYLAGLGYFLLGIIVGSGLWFGWGQALAIASPIEVHIHTNTWGFMSLVFAGLIVDLYPRWTGRELAWPGSIRPIFWLMAVGAMGAVLGPWLAANPLTVLGILFQQSATVWLLMNMIRPLRGAAIARQPGIWHIITSYVWQLAIVLGAPVIFLLTDLPSAGVEQTAPQVLIYAWMLQFGYAVLPYLLRRTAAPGAAAPNAAAQKEDGLGGSWLSLAAGHLGGIFLAASILVVEYSVPLLGAAYFIWFLSSLPILCQLGQILSLSAYFWKS